DGRKTWSLRDGDSADIQMMDESTETGESRILIESEAGYKHLEGDFGIHVRKRGSIEVKAKRPLRAVLGPLQPQEPRLRIDEAADEPGGGHTIDPQMLASDPGAAAVLFRIQLASLTTRRMRLVGREPCVQGSLGFRQGTLDLVAGLAGEEVARADGGDVAADGGELLPRFHLFEIRELGLQVLEPLDRFRILRSAVEQSDELRILLRRLRIERQQVRKAPGCLDLSRLLFENLPRLLGLRQQVGPIAQQPRAGRLHGTPDAHAQGRVVTWQIADQQQPHWRSTFHGERGSSS